ncbi:lanthionine synthetase LanC family protein [Aquimarina sp. M1]
MIDKKRNLLILDKIKDAIDENEKFEENLGVISGLSGILCFRFLLSKLLKCEKEFEKAKHLIQRGIESINGGYINSTYSNGITGFLWTLQFLEENDIIEIDDENFFSEVDDFLFNALNLSLERKDYDFLHGAIGYGVFFLKRYKNTNSHNLKVRYEKIIGKLIFYFEKTKIEDERGIRWEFPKRLDDNEDSYIDLGLAHGVPSILYFLSLVYEENIYRKKNIQLIRGSYKYILSTKQTNTISLFPAREYISLKTEKPFTRLAWCYGDVGLGLSLLKAADVTKNIELRKEALLILCHTSKRRGVEKNSIMDAGLCHGAYGLFHIYGKLYKKTKIYSFKESSEYWKKVGDDMAEFDKNKRINYSVDAGLRNWTKPYSLLEGLSGIGLSIISHLTNHEIEWDECLFI